MSHFGKGAASLRKLLREPGVFLAPAAYDPMTARIAQKAGCKALFFGGWAQAAQLCTPEPFLSMTEVIEGARLITRSVSIPVIADCGGGYGEPAHVWRTMRECEFAGIAAIQLEDQVFPKRAHYHKSVESVISTSEMIEKIIAAKESRTRGGDDQIVIIGRTDAALTEGFSEAVDRLNRFREAGCDMLMFFPNNMEEARLAPKVIEGPLVHVQGAGWGRPILNLGQLQEFGYRLGIAAVMTPLIHFKIMREVFTEYVKDGIQPLGITGNRELVADLQRLIGLEDYYVIEERTTEKEARVMPGAALHSN